MMMIMASIVEFTLHREHSFDISTLLPGAISQLNETTDTLTVEHTCKLIGMICGTREVTLLVRLVQATTQLGLGSDCVIPLFLSTLSSPKTHALTAAKCHVILQPIFKGTRVLLHKQKFLRSLVPLVTPLIESADLTDAVRCSVVRGIGSLLSSLPESLLSTEGASLSPIIFSSLSPTTTDCQGLRVVQFLLKSVPSAATMHLDTLIPQLLTVSKDSPTVEVRVEGLKTLESVCSEVHFTHVHLHRARVVRGVREVLADRKRVVRSAASRTLDKWIMLEP
eukprot:sb/3467921/